MTDYSNYGQAGKLLAEALETRDPLLAALAQAAASLAVADASSEIHSMLDTVADTLAGVREDLQDLTAAADLAADAAYRPPLWPRLRERLRAVLCFDFSGMSRHDRDAWKSARTMDDLGELVIGWLNGRLRQTPGHGGPPDPETGPLAADLIILNRAGFVTDNSQLAERDGGRAWNTWVSGFAGDDAEHRIRAAAHGTDLIVRACRGRHHECERIWGHRVCGWRDALGWWAGRCPKMTRQLTESWYVTVTDPQPGRNDLLWPALTAALARDAG